MKNAIALMFNDEYFDYAKACIDSIQENYPNHPVILAYYDGQDTGKIAYLEQTSQLRRMPYESDYSVSIGLNMEGLNLGLVNNRRIFFRYILWTDAFEEYDHILYLDADTLVLQPLHALFEQDEFFCVADHTADPECRLFYVDKHNDPVLRAYLEEDGLTIADGKDDMINSGVFIIPKAYRTPAYLESLLYLTYRYNDFMMFADQSAMTLWCNYHRIPIHKQYQYNFQACFYFDETIDAIPYEEVAIFHFTWWKPESEIFRFYARSAFHFLKVEEKFKRYQRPKVSASAPSLQEIGASISDSA